MKTRKMYFCILHLNYWTHCMLLKLMTEIINLSKKPLIHVDVFFFGLFFFLFLLLSVTVPLTSLTFFHHLPVEVSPSWSFSFFLFFTLFFLIFSFSLELQSRCPFVTLRLRKDFHERVSLIMISWTRIRLIIRWIGLWVVFSVFWSLFLWVNGSFWPVSFLVLRVIFIWFLRTFSWFPGPFSWPFIKLFSSFPTFSFASVLRSHSNLQVFHSPWRQYFIYRLRAQFSVGPFWVFFTFLILLWPWSFRLFGVFHSSQYLRWHRICVSHRDHGFFGHECGWVLSCLGIRGTW